ncbi:MAG: cytidine deaminase [Lachnospiraceae bacterium]|nr:cytidine deaminase [Lachnospiraceae bacterium]
MPIPELVKSAFAARKKAYAPYSKYLVGASILTKDDRIYSGVNIENASYGASNCAERTAIFKAVSEGNTKLKAVAVVGGAEDNEITGFAYPCGVCRQVMREFCVNPEEFIIIVAKSEEEYRTFTLNEILPASFGPEKLM